MKALVLYVVFVLVGAALAVLIGYYVERQTSSAVSLIVFLTMFFANFSVAWILTILVMDGSLKNAQGAQDQLGIEKAGRASMNAARESSRAARSA
jgi:NADH:ubiquinone oxidoreductase subunit 5 (subunit L)/multisubunit Na+/H+ antiporter MnhA subunit